MPWSEDPVYEREIQRRGPHGEEPDHAVECRRLGQINAHVAGVALTFCVGLFAAGSVLAVPVERSPEKPLPFEEGSLLEDLLAPPRGAPKSPAYQNLVRALELVNEGRYDEGIAAVHRVLGRRKKSATRLCWSKGIGGLR